MHSSRCSLEFAKCNIVNRIEQNIYNIEVVKPSTNQLSFHSIIINQSSLKALMKCDIQVRTRGAARSLYQESYERGSKKGATGVRLKDQTVLLFCFFPFVFISSISQFFSTLGFEQHQQKNLLVVSFDNDIYFP